MTDGKTGKTGKDDQLNSEFLVRIVDGIPLADLSLATLISNPRFSLYLSSARHIADLRPSPDKAVEGEVRGTFEDWHLITLHHHPTGRTSSHLVGVLTTTCRVTVTSLVRHVDLECNLVTTRNSLYSLGRRAEGEPSLHHLLVIIGVFRKWGIADGLGMPYVQFGDAE